MAVPIKAVSLGCAVVGLGGLGVWIFYPSSFPAWRSLETDKGFWDTSNTSTVHTNYSNKYGDDYRRFLVGVGERKDEKLTPENNDAWWKWSFKNRYSPEAQEGFKEIKDATSLKNKCDAAYKLSFASGVTDKVGDSGDKYKVEDIWKFCSPLEKVPVVLKDSSADSEKDYKTAVTSGTIKWGQASGMHDKLVSTETSSNDLFWQIQQDYLVPMSDANKSSDAFFTAKMEKGVTIKEACTAAYGVNKPTSDTTSSADAPSKSEILKYCSLKGKE